VRPHVRRAAVLKLIRALIAKAGHELSRVTGGDPNHQHNGQRVLAWHSLTDKGHHLHGDADGKAVMFNGTTKEFGDGGGGAVRRRVASRALSVMALAFLPSHRCALRVALRTLGIGHHLISRYALHGRRAA